MSGAESIGVFFVGQLVPEIWTHLFLCVTSICTSALKPHWRLSSVFLGSNHDKCYSVNLCYGVSPCNGPCEVSEFVMMLTHVLVLPCYRVFLCYGVSPGYIVSLCFGVNHCQCFSPYYGVSLCYGVNPCYDISTLYGVSPCCAVKPCYGDILTPRIRLSYCCSCCCCCSCCVTKKSLVLWC